MPKTVHAAAAALMLAALAGCDTNPWAKPEPPVQMLATQPAYPMNGTMVTPTGMTVYTFDKDSAGAGTSACNGPCAQNWPPVAAPADATPRGNFTVVKREDGSQQWAYKGWPLYTYTKDARTGDHAGDGFNKVWHVVKP